MSTWIRSSIRSAESGKRAEYEELKVKPVDDRQPIPVPVRLAVILSIAFLHLSCYVLVNIISSRRPIEAFKNLEIALDRKVPYLAWTGVIYYFGDLFIVLFAALIIWNMQRARFRRLAFVYAGMILAGAITQLLIPGRAPWSENAAAFQKAFRGFLGLRPYACFPSMHVALSVFPALLSLSFSKSAGLKILCIVCAVLIGISTLTFKEHYILDVIAGSALAIIFYLILTMGIQKNGLRSGEPSRSD
jgi:membrane-associated phospholipid phosphatase